MTRWIAICLVPAMLLISTDIGKAGHEKLKCDDCHTPHKPGSVAFQRGAWSTKHTDDGLATFKLYSSPSFNALNTDIGQPDGASRLCLGCHDGSYPGASGGDMFALGDLSRNHPISFTYDSALASRVPNGTLNDPSTTSSSLGGTIAKDLLDNRGKMQCTSCHDAHGKGDSGNMLRIKSGRNPGDQLCRVCHNM
jgi:predicted CXXCH cytochrome family protein